MICRVRLQFTLKALFLVILAVAVLLAALVTRLEQKRQERAAIATIEAHGGYVLYSDWNRRSETPWCVTRWARALLGDDFFVDVQYVSFDNGATEIGDEEMACFESLRELRVIHFAWKTSMSEAGLHHLRRCTKLEELSMWRQPISEGALKAILGMRRLKCLAFESRFITDAGLEAISKLPSLEELSLRTPARARITDRGLSYLSRATCLRRLDLTDADISDAGVLHLIHLPKLQKVNLYGSDVTDASLELLIACPTMREVDVDFTRVTKEGVARAREASPSCVIFHSCSKPPRR